MIRRLPLGLTAVACGLAGVAAAELWPGSRAAEWRVAVSADHQFAMPRQAPLDAAGALPAAITTTITTAILARPLFNPSRRPVQAARPPAAREAAFRLSGVIIYGTQRLAIFARAGDKTTIAASGARFGDWTVDSVEPDGVRLAGPEGSRRLRPAFATPPAAPPAAPAHDPLSAAMAASRHALMKLLKQPPS